MKFIDTMIEKRNLRKMNHIKTEKFGISTILKFVTVTALVLYAFSLFLPFIWIIINSLKDEIDYILYPFDLPKSGWMWKNYVDCWEALTVTAQINYNIITFGPMQMIGYTLIIAISGVIKNLLGNTFVAYVLARYKCKFVNFLWTYMIVMMFIPLGPSLVVSLKFAKWLGYWDNLVFYCLWGFGCFGANTLLLYASFKGLSDAYGEAAKIDGAGPWRIFIQIYLPMIFPMLATLFILALLGCWSDYMTTVVWLPSFPTLGYGLYIFRETAYHKGLGTPVVLSSQLITAVFSIVLYLCFQDLILAKMSVGTLKQ